MIPFTKANACGNDFLIVETRHVDVVAYRETARRLCARHTGVGADGIEYFEWTGERSGRVALYNADGSVAEISGNGTRCVAAWMADNRGAREGESLEIETEAGLRTCYLLTTKPPHFEIVSPMGMPTVESRVIKLATIGDIHGAVVSTGNPHFVIFVESENFVVQGQPWQQIGREICRHPDFPRQTNAEFVRSLNLDEIEIRIFERGVGPTESSGTGTCASAAASMALKGAHRKLSVQAPGGTQQVEWPDSESQILLTGPADLIASGESW